MIATRDNQTAAEVMGVNIALVKTGVFGVSAAVPSPFATQTAIRLALPETRFVTARAFDLAALRPMIPSR